MTDPLLLQRYSRAALNTAPKLAARTPTLGEDAHWIDKDRYFFLSERFDAVGNRMQVTPSIANLRTGQIDELINSDALTSLIERHLKRSSIDLSSSRFGLRGENRLQLAFEGTQLDIDLRTQSVLGASTSLAGPALFSPDGRHAVFIKGFDLYRLDRDSGEERPLTADGARHSAYGQLSETSLSAVSYRRHPYPIGLWSPDSTWFLTHRIEEEHLPEHELIEHAPKADARPVFHRYKYAVRGDPLPRAILLAIHIPTNRRVCFDGFPINATAFSPFSMRMVWFSDLAAWCVRFDRFWRRSELLRLDLNRGDGRVVYAEEIEDGYLDTHPVVGGTPNIRILEASNEFIWYSERDGWGHLYLHDLRSGELKQQITRGHWYVRDIVHVDEPKRLVLFLAGARAKDADPAQRTLCAVCIDGGDVETIAECNGDVFVAPNEPAGLDQYHPYLPSIATRGISPDGCKALVRRSSPISGNHHAIVDLNSNASLTLLEACPSESTARVLKVRAKAADGATTLHGILFLPPDFNQERSYPFIDYVYPGPQVAHQPQSMNMSRAAPAMSLAQLGFVTLMLDTRGVPISSRAFHQLGYPSLWRPQIDDHAAAVRDLRARYSFLRETPVGVLGHSAGGAAAAALMLHFPDLFDVGVAVCGAHYPASYAAVWSEKYEGPAPGDSTDDRDRSAQCLRGRLLLVTGDMDENVHPAQTLRLVDALIRANRVFDLIVVPNAGHNVLLDNPYAQKRIWDYFVQHLNGARPPDFEFAFSEQELARLAPSIWREIRE